MDTTNQVIDTIRKVLEMRKPSKSKILKYIYSLQANNSLSEFDFFDIIGKTYQMNRKFFMLSIYTPIRKKFKKIYGDGYIRRMDKYILEKYCLYEGEQILYELNGTISQMYKTKKKYNCQVKDGTLYFTNNRIVAQGEIALNVPEKMKEAYISHSSNWYGYWFPIKVSPPVITDDQKISYFSRISESRITIIPSEKGDHLGKITEYLRIKLEK